MTEPRIAGRGRSATWVTVLSWRRSSGIRRQQLKWLASGAAVTIASVVIGIGFASTGPTSALAQ